MKSLVILDNVVATINECISFNESDTLEVRAELYDLIEKRIKILEKLGVDCDVYYRRDKDDAMTYTRIVVPFDGLKVTIEI